jgi:hypothetical protein
LLEQVVGAGRRGLAADVIEPAEHDEVLPPGQRFVHRGVLPREPDDPAQLLSLAYHVIAGNGRPPGVRLQQRGENPHGGRLSGAVGPEQSKHGAFWHLEVKSIQRTDLAAAVCLDQSLRDDRGGCHVSSPLIGTLTVSM